MSYVKGTSNVASEVGYWCNRRETSEITIAGKTSALVRACAVWFIKKKISCSVFGVRSVHPQENGTQTHMLRATVQFLSAFYVVSVPDPHVTPARKRVWYLTSAFLVVLSQHGGVQVALSVELNQAHRWFVAKCVRQIIAFYIMLRTPAKLGSYELAYPVSR